MRTLPAVIALALAALACSDDGGGRVMFLESDEVRGQNRLCTYADALGARAETLRVWEACPPWIEAE